MYKYIPGIIGLSLLASAVGQGRQLDATSEVTVCLHNAVVSTPGTVERAKLVARNMFASIGVNIHWRESCLDSPQGLSINVSLVAEESGDDNSEALAEAYPYAGSTGHIMVRYDRVHDSAGPSRELEPVLLAHVLVHEITHVLQCLDRHSDAGVMKAHWTAEDYYDMRWKPLAFTPEDIELIHLGIQVLRSRMENQLQQEPVGRGIVPLALRDQ